MFLECLGEDDKIIEVNEHSLEITIPKTSLHWVLAGAGGPTEVKWHAVKLKQSQGCKKSLSFLGLDPVLGLASSHWPGSG